MVAGNKVKMYVLLRRAVLFYYPQGPGMSKLLPSGLSFERQSTVMHSVYGQIKISTIRVL